MMKESTFQGRKIVIATKHKKEKAIAPILQQTFDLEVIVPPDFDTDQLGTFSGETDRVEDPLSTARKKCLMAMELSSCNLAISNEGSFGPHPSIPFAYADDEIMFLLDKKNELEIFVRVLTTETNFNARSIETKEELKAFAQMAKFPSHALIIKRTKDDLRDMEKGITDSSRLLALFDRFKKETGAAYIETDMRALYNPTRMQVIEQATQKLVKKMLSKCPECLTPGLGITIVKEGLPCNLCNSPTRSILSYVYECQKCAYSREELYPNDKKYEDPMYCDFCNP
jgi:hypothetical protein